MSSRTDPDDHVVVVVGARRRCNHKSFVVVDVDVTSFSALDVVDTIKSFVVVDVDEVLDGVTSSA